MQGQGGSPKAFQAFAPRTACDPFEIVLSVEKEDSAFETLRLRSFLRQFNGSLPAEYYRVLNDEIAEPDWSRLFPAEWKRACLETMKLELGSPGATQEIDGRLADISKRHGDNVILIGGPPCQAYSLVGRARNKGTEGYEASKDHRHFLYQEYIRILQKLMPAVFVMENVKGLLSSSIGGERVFDQVLNDLSNVGHGSYVLVPLTPRSGQALLPGTGHPPPFDFVVRAEDHGIPQSRHRVIVVGIRADIAGGVGDGHFSDALLPKLENQVTVQDVLRGMPRLRSGLSKSEDDGEAWKAQTSRLMRQVANAPTGLPENDTKVFRRLADKIAASLEKGACAPGPLGLFRRPWLYAELSRRPIEHALY